MTHHSLNPVNSGWDIEYSLKIFRKTNDISSLKYDCITSEGVECTFIPNKDGLHVMDCSKYFGIGKSGYIFGKKIINNDFDGGKDMCRSIHGTIENAKAFVSIDDAIDTVTKSKNNFSKQDQLKASKVRRFQHVAAHPSDQTLIYSAMTNGIKNNPITKREVVMALDMLGKSRYSVQGKTVQHQPDAVDTESISVPTKILDCYNSVTHSIDVMHVNKVPLLISISEHIHYGTINRIPAMAVYIRPRLGCPFLRGCISLKNQSYCPLLRHSTSPFKSTCLLIYLKEVLIRLYGPHQHC
jgi:hypothetical protein